MEYLDIKKHSPEEFPGKAINIKGHQYIIGDLIGEGGFKLVYQLINYTSGLCHFVINIPLDQELAYGLNIDKGSSDNGPLPYSGRSMYEHNRELAKLTYHYSGYSSEKPLPLWADFLDVSEFAELNNQYNGTFIISEHINGNCDSYTGGIYVKNNSDNILTLFKIYLRISNKHYDDLCDLCLSYLEHGNSNDDNIIEQYLIAKLHNTKHITDCDRNKLIDMTWKMINIEPYYRRHIYIAIQIFNMFSRWEDVISVFEHIKDLFYEIYSQESIMEIIVHAYKNIGLSDKATYYSKYLSNNEK